MRWLVTALLLLLPITASADGLGRLYAPRTNAAEETVYYSADFNGTDEFIELYDTGYVTLGINDAFTISIWCKPDTVATGPRACLDINVGTVQGRKVIRQMATATTLQTYLQHKTGGSAKDYRYPTSLSAGTWYHIVVTWDGSALTTYINGSAPTPTKIYDGAGTQDTTPVDMVVGAQSNGTWDGMEQFWNGKVGPIAIWSTALIAGEVAAIHTGKFGIDLTSDSGDYTSSSTLVHFWKVCQAHSSNSEIGTDSKGTLNLRGQFSTITTTNCIEDAP